PGKIDVLIYALPCLAVLAERGQRGGWDRVHRVGTDQLLDVVGVGVARVLGRGARPQRPLQLRTGLLQLFPTRAAERLPETLIGDLRVRDRSLSIQSFERALLSRIGAQLDLLGQGLVDLGVDAADEKAGEAGDAAQLAPALAQLPQPGQVGLHHLAVPVDREDVPAVDIVTL